MSLKTDNVDKIFEEVFRPLIEEDNYYDAVGALVELNRRSGTLYSEDLHNTVKQLAIQKAAMVRSEHITNGADREEAFREGLIVLYEIYDLLRNERDDL